MYVGAAIAGVLTLLTVLGLCVVRMAKGRSDHQ
jgi:hypothetical protein